MESVFDFILNEITELAHNAGCNVFYNPQPTNTGDKHGWLYLQDDNNKTFAIYCLNISFVCAQIVYYTEEYIEQMIETGNISFNGEEGCTHFTIYYHNHNDIDNFLNSIKALCNNNRKVYYKYE